MDPRFLEGTEVSYQIDSGALADSPVGGRGVVRLLQYGVSEGRGGGGVVWIPGGFFANRYRSFILLEVGKGDGTE